MSAWLRGPMLADAWASGRNNFNLLRLFAAWLVIYGHAWAITGSSGSDLVTRLTQFKFAGGVAVDVFFFISGLLIAASLQRNSVRAYLTSRALRILPALVVLLSAVQMFRASGAMELLTGLLSPVLEGLGIPPEPAVRLLVRPVSGSGALAVGSQLMEQYGPDSYIGRVTAVMLGCSETTFYTVAVYYGAAGIRRTRHTVPAALAADAAAFIAAAWAVRVFFP